MFIYVYTIDVSREKVESLPAGGGAVALGGVKPFGGDAPLRACAPHSFVTGVPRS